MLLLATPLPAKPLPATPLPETLPCATPLTPSRWPPAAAPASGAEFPKAAAAAAWPTLLLVDRRDAAIGAEQRRKLQASLSCAELERLQRYRLPEDADRFLLGRGLMRRWLAQLLGCSAADLPFTSLGHGKPMVAGAPPFNVSHSGDLILLAVHRQRAVGVDLERDRERFDWQSIARRYLGEAVVQRLRHDHPDEQAQRRAFLLEWCCLEARLKADGRGLSGLDGRGDGTASPWTGPCWPLQLPAGYQGAAALLPAPGRAEASTASGGIHIASP